MNSWAGYRCTGLMAVRAAAGGEVSFSLLQLPGPAWSAKGVLLSTVYSFTEA